MNTFLEFAMYLANNLKRYILNNIDNFIFSTKNKLYLNPSDGDINIVFLTGNQGKYKEFLTCYNVFKESLNDGDDKEKKIKITHMKVDLDEIQSTSNEEVLDYKINLFLKTYPHLLYKPNTFYILEDTGLYIKDINDFPGALIKFYLNSLGCEGIASKHSGSQARSLTYVGIIPPNCRPQKIYFSVQGSIVNSQGANGFGYDSIFNPIGVDSKLKSSYPYPDLLKEDEQNGIIPFKDIQENETYADLDNEKKIFYSPRSICFYNLFKRLYAS